MNHDPLLVELSHGAVAFPRCVAGCEMKREGFLDRLAKVLVFEVAEDLLFPAEGLVAAVNVVQEAHAVGVH